MTVRPRPRWTGVALLAVASASAASPPSKLQALPSGLQLWNDFIVPAANFAIKKVSNTSLGECEAAPTKRDSTCYACPSDWYADCKRDCAKTSNESWRWIGERGCPNNVFLCQPTCANLTSLPSLVGTLDAMRFGCCVAGGATGENRESCIKDHGDWAWVGSAESTDNPDFTAGLTSISGLFSGLDFMNATQVNVTGSGVDPNTITLTVDQRLTSSLSAANSLAGHVTGLGCSAQFKTGFEKSSFDAPASLKLVCPPPSGPNNKSAWTVGRSTVSALSVKDLKLKAIGDGSCYPTGCYVSGVCETMQAIIPTLADLIIQIIKNSLFNDTLGPLISGAITGAMNGALEGKVLPVPCHYSPAHM